MTRIDGMEFWEWYDSRPPINLSRLQSFEDVEEGDIEWFWEGWIPYGELTVIGGDPKVGKSTFTQGLAASASRRELATLGSWSEDPPGVVKRRLLAADGVLNRVFQVPPKEVLLPGRLDDLEMYVLESKARLVVLDHWLRFLDDSVQAQRTQQVYAALDPLETLAKRHNLAVILVCHLNVGGDGISPLNRIPTGLRHAARSLLMLTRDDNIVRLDHVAGNYDGIQPVRFYRHERDCLVDTSQKPSEAAGGESVAVSGETLTWDFTPSYDD